MRGPRALVLVATFLLGSIAASPAAALSLSPSPVVFTQGAFQGTVTLLSITTGTPAGGVITWGSGSPGDTTVLVQVTNTGSVAISSLGIFIPSGYAPVTQVGWVPGASEPDSLVDIAGAYSLYSNFYFPGGANVLAPGETTNPFFVSFGVLSVGTTVRFLGTSPGLTYQSYADTVVVVPEPATALLLGGALAALALASRRRRIV